MRIRAALIALCLLTAVAPAAVQARATSGGGCATTSAKLAQTPRLELPADAKISSKEIAFEVDVGSDGRVRALQMDRSSGDGAVDLSVRQTLQAASYEPAQTGCVAYSGGLRLGYELPAPGAAQPTPPAKLDPTCTPEVLVFLTPAARDRKRTGTAIVAVELDAAGTQTTAPALRKSTGSPVLDQEAVRIAHTAQYNFLRGGPCAPQPFTYLLELTFL
jgi:TonB family protein